MRLRVPNSYGRIYADLAVQTATPLKTPPVFLKPEPHWLYSLS